MTATATTESDVFYGSDGNLYAGPKLAYLAYRRAIGIPESYEHAELDNYETPTPEHERVHRSVCVWEFGLSGAIHTNGRHSLFLSGQTGTGKTHLAVGAAKSVLRLGLHPRFIDGSELLNALGAGFTCDFDEFVDYEVLLIDDLGASSGTAAQAERLRIVLTKRFARQRPTIITSNLSFPHEVLKMLGDRVISRMEQSCEIIGFRPTMGDWRRR